jgi:hypothetical protein
VDNTTARLPNECQSFLDNLIARYRQKGATLSDPEWREEWGVENRGALGRAERMVVAFIDSARALAKLIQLFKLQEIDAAIERLSRRKLATPADRTKAFTEHKRLNAIRARLTKEVRHSFPQAKTARPRPRRPGS